MHLHKRSGGEVHGGKCRGGGSDGEARAVLAVAGEHCGHAAHLQGGFELQLQSASVAVASTRQVVQWLGLGLLTLRGLGVSG
jgi:hypothetical protein